jgi:hypothetical protein
VLRWFVGSTAFAFAVVAFACNDSAIAQPCTGVPENGCPLSHGVACEDPACQAIYACRENNRWELVKQCPNYDPDAGTLPVQDASPVVDASIDAPSGAYGGPGCGVLQDPDCPLGLALSCSGSCCGCEDLFVCTNGAWELWGSCGDAGLVPDPHSE